MACLWQSDEHLTAIPDADLAEEGRRCFSAREAQTSGILTGCTRTVFFV
jgi:hypothetical protein